MRNKTVKVAYNKFVIINYFSNSNLYVLGESDNKKPLNEAYSDQQIEDSIDQVIKMMDKDKDGFITYHEFVTSGHYAEDDKNKKKK